MKTSTKYIKHIFFMVFATFLLASCVHDDKYDNPDMSNYQCQDLTKTMTLAELKAKFTGNANKTYYFPKDSKDIIEGYVSSTDETGNIYKTIYIQDAPENPTHGFTISVNAVSTYTNYPQGSKIYIKLAGLAVGTYGGVVQLGVKDATVADPANTNIVARIPETSVPKSIIRSCAAKVNIVPKVIKFTDMKADNDNLIGCLIQADNVEFDSKALCTSFAPNGQTVDKAINQKDGNTVTSRIVRNSGYASFANLTIPAGNGKFVGILSKYNTTYQMYINKVTDLKEMTEFPRIDGMTSDPCQFNPTNLTAKTVAEVKRLISGNALTEIKDDIYLKAKVTTSDATGNFFKYIYVEDATGGIRVNIDKSNIYLDPRFYIGKDVIIKLKGLYIGDISGELQLGSPFDGKVGRVAEVDIYKYFFDSKEQATAVTPTERTITQLTAADVGKWVKLKNLEFIDADLGNTYAAGSVTNRTLQDCNGNKILLRTSNFADFAGVPLDEGKGDVYAIVSVFNGVYQLWINNLLGADLDDPRCDGTVPVKYNTVFADGFDTLANWTAVNVTGSQVWTTTTFGNPRPSAYMDGNRQLNEDWLISKAIAIDNFSDVFFTFETDGRFSGNPLEVYVTENYTGDVGTTTWTKYPGAVFDTDLSNFSGFVNSGRLSLNDFKGKQIRIAFKYTSISGSSTTWELDNVAVKGTK